MCSFAVWTTMMCLPSIGTSACRPCKVTPECPTLLTLRLLESPSRWTIAEPLDTSFMQPQQKLGKHQGQGTRPGSHQGGRPVQPLGHSHGLCWGSEAPRHGTQIQYGKYLFYRNVKFEEQGGGVPMGAESSEPRPTGGSPMGEGPGPSSSSAAGGSAFAEGPDADMGTLLSTWTTCRE